MDKMETLVNTLTVLMDKIDKNQTRLEKIEEQLKFGDDSYTQLRRIQMRHSEQLVELCRRIDRLTLDSDNVLWTDGDRRYGIDKKSVYEVFDELGYSKHKGLNDLFLVNKIEPRYEKSGGRMVRSNTVKVRTSPTKTERVVMVIL